MARRQPKRATFTVSGPDESAEFVAESAPEAALAYAVHLAGQVDWTGEPTPVEVWGRDDDPHLPGNRYVLTKTRQSEAKAETVWMMLTAQPSN